MRLLVLGGGVFVGRHIVEAALAAGHTVTTFSRGREPVPSGLAVGGSHRGLVVGGPHRGVEALVGDRRGDLGALRGREWDAAIDVAAYVPSVVRSAGDVLRDNVGHYALVSTRSVYRDLARARVGEPVEALDDAELAAAEALVVDGRSTARVYGRAYGGLKVRCEVAAADAYGDRLLVLRPGLIVGPHDPTDRFTYWPARVARGGRVLAPGDPARTVRFVDVRDFAAWTVAATASATAGTYDVTGADGVTMGSLLDACREACRDDGGGAGGDAELVWADEAFLVAHGVTPWSELPLWVHAADNGFLDVASGPAIAAGLRFRPVVDTARDTLRWDQARVPGPREAGLTAEREAELLALLGA